MDSNAIKSLISEMSSSIIEIGMVGGFIYLLTIGRPESAVLGPLVMYIIKKKLDLKETQNEGETNEKITVSTSVPVSPVKPS